MNFTDAGADPQRRPRRVPRKSHADARIEIAESSTTFGGVKA
jgi:hypothetical protein